MAENEPLASQYEPPKLDWYNRIKLEDPEKYAQCLQRRKDYHRQTYHTNEVYREKILAHKKAAHKLKAADPEWRARRNAYELARRAAKKSQGL